MDIKLSVKPNEGFYCLTCTKSWCTWFTFWFIIHTDGHWQLEHSNQEPRRARSLNWLLMESREVVCAARRMISDYRALRDLLQLFRGSEAFFFLHKTLFYFWPHFILYNIIFGFCITVSVSPPKIKCVWVCVHLPEAGPVSRTEPASCPWERRRRPAAAALRGRRKREKEHVNKNTED